MKTLKLKTSLSIAIYVFALHFIALSAIIVVIPDYPMLTMLTPIVIYSFIKNHKLLATLKSSSSVIAIETRNNKTWKIHYRNGNKDLATLQDDSIKLSYLIALRLKVNSRSNTKTILLPRDTLSKKDFHYLHLALWEYRHS